MHIYLQVPAFLPWLKVILLAIKQALCSGYHKDVMRDLFVTARPSEDRGLNSSSDVKELSLIIWPSQW